jgi:hypothetical protein
MLAACGGGGRAPGAPGPSGPVAADTEPPVILSTSGAHDGDTLSGTVPLRVQATDNVGVTRLRLELHDAPLATVSGSGTAFDLPTALFPNGPCRLRIYADDAAGNASYPVELRLTFANGAAAAGAWPSLAELAPAPPAAPPPAPAPGPAGNPPSTTPPPSAADAGAYLPPPFDPQAPPAPGDTTPPNRMVVMSLHDYDTVWGVVQFDFIAFDDIGIMGTAAGLDGQVLNAQPTPLLHVRWDSRTVPDGPYSFVLRAWDGGGNSITSFFHVNVANGQDNAAPRINRLQFHPAYPHAHGLLRFQADIAEDRGLASVAVEVEGSPVYQAAEQSLDFTWDTTLVPDGDYLLTVTATDTAGKQDRCSTHVNVENGGPVYTVSGRLLAPNGQDPVPGYSVWVNRREPNGAVFYSDHLAGGSEVDGYTGGSLDGCVTGPDGRFSLELPRGKRLLHIAHPNAAAPAWSLDLPLDLTADLAVPEAQTTLQPEAGPTLAVVTGDGESLPDLLAKVGYGQTDGRGALVPGTERFMLVDGNGSLPDAQYANFPELLADGSALDGVDCLLIAAGGHYESWLASAPAARSRLRQWLATPVAATGANRVLYCGGSSYDIIEQSFPSVFDFAGDDTHNGLSGVPETLDAAQSGPALPQPLLSTAPTLADWLSGRGIGFDADRHLAAPPIAAGWVQIVAANGRFPNASLPLFLGPDPTQCPPLSYVCGPQSAASGFLVVNSLLLPPAPAPGWTVQERWLEFSLLAGWG